MSVEKNHPGINHHQKRWHQNSKGNDMTQAVSIKPSMDEGGFKFFDSILSSASCLLEYGSGGSTSYAANIKKVKKIISVDTSQEWIVKVCNSISDVDTEIFIDYCDLGPVGDWGVPINREKSAHFWQYMVRPWQIAKTNNLVPNAILIDGRFRVASFLYSLISARIGTVIMFDDYLDRQHYFVVEKFCRLQEKHGRMGVFYVDNNFSMSDVVSAIAEYSTNWD
jgi:hypothetical protein